jgi:hypothetical protein
LKMVNTRADLEDFYKLPQVRDSTTPSFASRKEISYSSMLMACSTLDTGKTQFLIRMRTLILHHSPSSKT